MKRPAVAMLSLAVLAACDQPKVRDQGPTATASVPVAAEPLPAMPEWAAAYMGKGLRDVFPETGECVGNTDTVKTRYAGPPAGVAIIGWGWNVTEKAPVARIVVVDKEFTIIGAGETGLERPDVPKARSDVTSSTTGWRAVTTATSGGLDAYGVTNGGRGVCKLGHLDL
ncbi:hypothetical protein [Phenylobacterium sp.]|uniref:hypothetical protein n=1 Tax=Phenylobacterium sp. TaxID=1871053 RepID=UPI00391C36B4